MKTKYVVLALLAILFAGRPLYAQSVQKGTEVSVQKEIDPISQVKLNENSLPEGLKIVKESPASAEQLKKVRVRFGFPVVSLVNQVLSSGNEQAQVNYLSVHDESWLDAGYSFLAETDGKKCLVFTKGNILMEVAATKPELEARIAHLLGADPIHFLKLRLMNVPALWELMKEKVYLDNDLREVQHEMNLPVEAALAQEFGAGHTNLRIHYYRCSASNVSMELANRLAEQKKPILKLLIGVSGPLVVAAESQNEVINKQAMNLMNWPAEHELQVFPILW